jgi:hypothetical protein
VKLSPRLAIGSPGAYDANSFGAFRFLIEIMVYRKGTAISPSVSQAEKTPVKESADFPPLEYRLHSADPMPRLLQLMYLADRGFPQALARRAASSCILAGRYST